LNLKNVLKGLAVKDLEAAVDFNCKIWVKRVGETLQPDFTKYEETFI